MSTNHIPFDIEPTANFATAELPLPSAAVPTPTNADSRAIDADFRAIDAIYPVELASTPAATILDRGVLTCLTVSVWSGRVKMPTTLLSESADADWVRATKALVDRSVLAPIERIGRDARSYLAHRSLPFPLASIHFIPASLVPAIDDKFTEFRRDFDNAVEHFVSHYDTFIAHARDKLGSLFSETDYPPHIRSKFGLHWRYFTIGEARQTSVVSPELYRRELQRFHTMIDDFRHNAVTTLRSQFGELVDHLLDRLTPAPDGSRKIFQARSIDTFREFLTTFDALNVADDRELAALVQRATDLLHGVQPQALRDDTSLRTHVATAFQRIQSEFDRQIIDAPRRRIRRPDTTDPSA